MPDNIKHFLLVLNRKTGEQVLVEEFGTDGSSAVKRYGQLEEIHAEEPWFDIVLLGSDSLDTIKITHANYFSSSVRGESVEEWLLRNQPAIVSLPWITADQI